MAGGWGLPPWMERSSCGHISLLAEDSIGINQRKGESNT